MKKARTRSKAAGKISPAKCESLRESVRAGAIANAGRDLIIANEWFALEEEAFLLWAEHRQHREDACRGAVVSDEIGNSLDPD